MNNEVYPPVTIACPHVSHEPITLLALQHLIKHQHAFDTDPDRIALVQLLSVMPFRHIARLAGEAIGLQLTVNPDKFEATMNKIKLFDTEQNYFEWAIANGASNTLLALMFPALADSQVIAQLRRVLIPNHTGFTRKVAIKEETTKEQICQKWQVLSDGLQIGLFERLRELHRQFGGQYDLNMLYAVLREYEAIL
jgi:hypothetical protein